MDEAGSAEERSGGGGSSFKEPNGPEKAPTDSAPSTAGAQGDAGGSSAEVASSKTAASAPAAPASDSSSSRHSVEPSLPSDETAAQASAGPTSTLAPESQEAASKETTPPSVAGPVEAAKADETAPMELESRSPSPETSGARSSAGADDEADQPRQPSAPLPDQISSVAQPREAAQEIEAQTAGEVKVVSPGGAGAFRLTTKLQVRDKPASAPANALRPYESPLRYFNAYRFHPEYQRTVSGGLKSLTYSNRIDVQKEFCPFELNGEQCPANCEFQHFSTICPPGE